MDFTLNSLSGFSLLAVSLTPSTLDRGEEGRGGWGGSGAPWIVNAIFYHLCFISSTIKYMLTLPPSNLENVKN